MEKRIDGKEAAQKIRKRYDHAQKIKRAAALPRLSEMGSPPVEMPGQSLSQADGKEERS